MKKNDLERNGAIALVLSCIVTLLCTGKIHPLWVVATIVAVEFCLVFDGTKLQWLVTIATVALVAASIILPFVVTVEWMGEWIMLGSLPGITFVLIFLKEEFWKD